MWVVTGLIICGWLLYHPLEWCVVSSHGMLCLLSPFEALLAVWELMHTLKNQRLSSEVLPNNWEKSPFNKLKIYSPWPVLCLHFILYLELNLFWIFHWFQGSIISCNWLIFWFFPSTGGRISRQSVSIIFPHKKLPFWFSLGYIVLVMLAVPKIKISL